MASQNIPEYSTINTSFHTGDHIAMLYKDSDEHLSTIIPFLKQGVEENDRCIYIVDDSDAHSMENVFREHGLPVGHSNFSIITSTDAYIVHDTFDLQNMMELLKYEVDKTIQSGFRALRITGEMSWALRDYVGKEDLLQYESVLNKFFDNNRCIGLCQYDLNRFPEKIIREVIYTHPKILYKGALCENFHYIPPEEYVNSSRDTAEIDRLLARIFDRAQIEKKLNENIKKFHALYHEVPIGYQSLNELGVITETNDTMCSILGYDRDEIIGRKFVEFLAQPDDAAFDRIISRLVKSGFINDELLNIIDSQGMKHTIVFTGKVLTSDQGHVSNFLCTFDDITDKEQVMDSLKSIEREKSTLLSSISEIVLYLSPNRTVQWANLAASEFFKKPVSELIGKKCTELWKMEKKECEKCPVEIVLQGGDPHVLEINLDDDRILEINANPVRDDDGNITGVVQTALDISQQRFLEKQLHQAQKMEAIGKLAGGIAHDFNNLLTVICGYSNLILSQTDADDPMYRSIELVHTAGKQAENMTRQLLAFSRKNLLEPQEVDLNEFLKRNHNMFSRLIGEDIDFHIQPEPELWKCQMDPGQLEQVFLNLVVNARDAMPKGGVIEIKMQNTVFHKATPMNGNILKGNYVQVDISDTGNGIPQEVMEHIFEPFYTTKNPEKGTGLGLSTLYGIIDQSNGAVTVTSTVGAGTTFTLYLPQPEYKDNTAESMKSDIQLRKGKETILLVEDDHSVRELISQALRNFGYNVIEAPEGETALQLFEDNGKSVQLVISDVVMPKMNGPAMVNKIKKMSPEVKVMFMSGYSQDIVLKHGIDSGEVDFLQKPFTMDDVVSRISEIMQNRFLA